MYSDTKNACDQELAWWIKRTAFFQTIQNDGTCVTVSDVATQVPENKYSDGLKEKMTVTGRFDWSKSRPTMAQHDQY